MIVLSASNKREVLNTHQQALLALVPYILHLDPGITRRIMGTLEECFKLGQTRLKFHVTPTEEVLTYFKLPLNP